MPQLVPAVLLLVLSTHVIAPVVQDVVPILQAPGLPVQVFPGVQAMQEPLPLQTRFVPQLTPPALLLPSMQVIAPVEQDVVPFLQAVGLPVQATPAVQGTQVPLPLHTMLVPQLVPAVLLPLSTHVCVPDAQDVVPVLQMPGLVVHAVFMVHGPQVPLLHTWFVPHDVPFALFPISAQTGTPVTHEVVPTLHAFACVQAAPGVHAPHTPLALQTMFVPQLVPAARFRLVSEQVMLGEQVCVPAWHGFVGVHASPAVHDTQLPVWQTMFVPHDVPLATLPDTVQTGAPLVHTFAAVLQGMPDTEQLEPTVHGPHTPLALQTMLVPQLVPAVAFTFRSVQTGAPVEQASIPR